MPTTSTGKGERALFLNGGVQSDISLIQIFRCVLFPRLHGVFIHKYVNHLAYHEPPSLTTMHILLSNMVGKYNVKYGELMNTK